LLTHFLEHFSFGLFQFNIISSLHETQSELIKYVQIFQMDLCYIIFLHYIDVGLIGIYYFYVKHYQYDEYLIQ